MEENSLLSENIDAIDLPKPIPIWKFVGLLIFSFNLYQFYWFYRNWKDIKNSFKEYKDISPKLRLLGLFIPLLGIYLIYNQFNIIQEKSIEFDENNYKANSILILVLIFIISSLHYLPMPFNLLSVLNTLPYIFVQSELNKLWIGRKKEIFCLRIPEAIILALGLLVWCHILLAIFKYM